MIRATTILLLLLTSACEDDAAPPPRGAVGVVGVATMTAQVSSEAAAATREATPPERRFLGPSQVRETVENTAAAEAPERDLGAELRAAIGAPSACGSLGTQTGRFQIQLSITVTENGVVVRGNARGPIPQGTLDCLTRRLQGVRLRAPIPGAPRVVTASLILEGTAGTPERIVEIAAEGAPSTPGVQPVEARAGQTIAGPSGETVAGPGAQTINGPSGTAISGPSGVAIGN